MGDGRTPDADHTAHAQSGVRLRLGPEVHPSAPRRDREAESFPEDPMEKYQVPSGPLANRRGRRGADGQARAQDPAMWPLPPAPTGLTVTVPVAPRASLVAQLVKNPPRNARDPSSIGGWGRSPGGGHGNPLQYSWLENPMDRGAWWATVHGGCKVLDTTEQLSTAHLKSRPASTSDPREARRPC